MEPIILRDDAAAWGILTLGVVALCVGIFITIKKKFDVVARIAAIVIGIAGFVYGPRHLKTRMELHEDKIVQHIHKIPPERTVVEMEGITSVSIVVIKDGEKEKKTWTFFRGEEEADTILPAAVWRKHTEAIYDYLTEKGVRIEIREAR